MTCAEAAPFLAAAADQALDAPRHAELEAHLAACEACRRSLDEQAMVAGLLAATPAAEVSRAFLARLNARIDDSETVLGLVNYRAWTLRLAPVALALALVALFATASNTSPDTTSFTSTAPAAAQSFSPASLADWERDVSANALLEAALPSFAGDKNAR